MRSPITQRPLEHTRLTTNILAQEAISEALRLASTAKAVELEEGGKPGGGGQGGNSEDDTGSKAQGARGSVEDGRGGGGGGCEIVGRIFPHLSMEDPPALAAGDGGGGGGGGGLDELWRQLSLEIIRCRFKLV